MTVCLLTAVLAAGMPAEASEAAGTEETSGSGWFTVGNMTHLTGDFFTGLWGNSTSDLDVRYLIHGYDLIRWDSSKGLFVMDPSAVENISVTEDEKGDRIFRMTLCRDLRYSDGSAITAKDYVFSILLSACPQIRELGGDTQKLAYISGFDAFNREETPFLSGVRLEDEYVFSVKVDHEYLPYFYELARMDFMPYPIAEIAPGFTVKDDGEGAYIAASETANAKGEGFSSRLLRETVLDPETGYRTHPAVTSGPYCLDSFDGETAVFTRNPEYKGDWEGNKPVPDHLVYTLSDNKSLAEDLKEGRFSIVNKVANKDALNEALALVREDDRFSSCSYPRSGLSFITFCGEHPALSSLAVRKAAAFCMDQEKIAEGYEGPYGVTVNGYYGIGQWMVNCLTTGMYPLKDPETADEKDDYDAMRKAWEALSLEDLPSYATGERIKDIETAVTLLEEDGWTLNKEGGPFDPAKDKVRCKRMGDDLVSLELKLGYPQGNAIGELFPEYLVKPLEEAGILLSLEELPMEKLFREYYGWSGETEDSETSGDESPSCDMLYLATNFDLVFDPVQCFSVGDDGISRWKHTQISDEELYQLASEMLHTVSGDALGYCTRWVAFQKRFAEVLPVLPVYSNVYFDIYAANLQDYRPSEQMNWPQAFMQASWKEEP